MLYRFDAYQQAGTFRRQKFNFFHLKLIAEFNRLSQSVSHSLSQVLQVTGSGKKMTKTTKIKENAYMWFPDAKG